MHLHQSIQWKQFQATDLLFGFNLIDLSNQLILHTQKKIQLNRRDRQTSSTYSHRTWGRAPAAGPCPCPRAWMDPVRGVVCYSGLSSIDLFVGDMIQSMLPVTVIRNYHGTESITCRETNIQLEYCWSAVQRSMCGKSRTQFLMLMRHFYLINYCALAPLFSNKIK